MTYFPAMSLLLQPEGMLQAGELDQLVKDSKVVKKQEDFGKEVEEALDDTDAQQEVWQVQETDDKA